MDTAADAASWTDYGTESNPSGWKSMGGVCGLYGPIGIANHGDYSLTIYCESGGSNDDWYYKTRSSGVSGGWGAWHDTGVGFGGQLPAGILFSNGTTS
jgi:hypothetical protein